VKKSLAALTLAAGLLFTSVAPDALATHGWCQKCRPTHTVVRNRGTADEAVRVRGHWVQTEYLHLVNRKDCTLYEDGSIAC
jgi:hypothetical protein